MISKTGRKVYNSSVVKKVWKYGIDEVVSENRNERKAINKIKRQNSAEYKSAQMGRNIAQQMTETRDDIIDSLRELAKSIAGEIINNFSNEFEVLDKAKKINNYIQPQISNEQIENFIADYLQILKRLQVMIGSKELAPAIDRYLNTYEAMFKKLIDLDVRFAMYSPQKVLIYKEIENRINGVEGELQAKLKHYAKKLETEKDYIETAEFDENKNNIRRENANRMIDEIREKEFHSHIKMINSVELATIDFYEFVVNQLHLQEINERTLKFADIKNVLYVLGDVALKSIKKYSDSEALNQYSGWEECDPYTDLFNRLMDLNVKFAFFAPTKSLNRMDIDFKRLTEKERGVMLKILVDKGLWANDEFYENYKDLFTSIKTEDVTV